MPGTLSLACVPEPLVGFYGRWGASKVPLQSLCDVVLWSRPAARTRWLCWQTAGCLSPFPGPPLCRSASAVQRRWSPSPRYRTSLPAAGPCPAACAGSMWEPAFRYVSLLRLFLISPANKIHENSRILGVSPHHRLVNGILVSFLSPRYIRQNPISTRFVKIKG